jgi:hypothetical protein
VSIHPSLRPAGDWVSMHPSLSACIREVVVAGCLSILSFQQRFGFDKRRDAVRVTLWTEA